MAKLKCNSCGGTYPDTRDGKTPAYHHVCPDKIVGLAEITDKDNKVTTPAVFIDTPNPRNENLMPHPDKPGEFVMISEGSGVTEVK